MISHLLELLCILYRLLFMSSLEVVDSSQIYKTIILCIVLVQGGPCDWFEVATKRSNHALPFSEAFHHTIGFGLLFYMSS